MKLGENELQREILWGAKSIAAFIGTSVDTVYALGDDPSSPVFKPAGRYCALKSELWHWLRTKKAKS